jgi:hypothetical protein
VPETQKRDVLGAVSLSGDYIANYSSSNTQVSNLNVRQFSVTPDEFCQVLDYLIGNAPGITSDTKGIKLCRDVNAAIFGNGWQWCRARRPSWKGVSPVPPAFPGCAESPDAMPACFVRAASASCRCCPEAISGFTTKASLSA